MNLARLTCVCALFLAVSAQARSLSKEEKKADFEQLASMIKSHYGPYELKKANLKIDVDAMVARYATQAENVSNFEFYHLINKFVAEFQDSHFRSAVQTNYLTTLGFVADRIDGKVLIDRIVPEVLPKTIFPFERGDEIVAIDGKPATDIVDGLSKYLGMGNRETALRMAAVFIGYRPATLLPPKRGISKVTIRRGTSTIEDTVTMLWHETGKLEEDPELETWSAVPADYAKLAVDDVFAGVPQGEQAFRCSGSTRTAPPRGTKVLMASPFVAYYHPTPKGNIGYLRIPHYNWGKDEELRFKQYEWAVDQLEKNTVGLIIDQDHNCGGSVVMVENMVGLFADKPFKGLEFQFMASRSEYLKFQEWAKGEDAKTIDGSSWLDVVGLVKSAWQSRSRMSAKTTFHASRLLNPNAIRYTKPILVLVDEMSGSGGDAFPAMMQGIGRAKLMGTRTMGAGGHVEQMPSLNYSVNQINMTKSLFYRPDGTPVENNGAVPDIAYQPTRDDFLYQYRNYQKQYLEEIAKLIP